MSDGPARDPVDGDVGWRGGEACAAVVVVVVYFDVVGVGWGGEEGDGGCEGEVHVGGFGGFDILMCMLFYGDKVVSGYSNCGGGDDSSNSSNCTFYVGNTYFLV